MINTKYNFPISAVALTADINRLTSQIWKLIPMRENEENWHDQLLSVIIEIAGLSEIFSDTEEFLILLSKLEGLLQIDIEFYLYRKTVFESISLLRSLVK